MGKKIAVLGSGNVGQVLANGLRDLGHEVVIGRREASKVDNWDGPVATFADAAADAEIVTLAVKGAAAEELIDDIKDSLKGKTVLDTTNPIADKPPVDGVLVFFTTLEDSLMERLQKMAPDAHFVKAFSSVGAGNMVKPDYKEGKPSMFICGDNEWAKAEASELIKSLGWEVEDMGSVVAARAIEPLCMLWCIPGMRDNQWSHAFKLLKK